MMKDEKVQNFVKDVLENMPKAWLNLTTHRLDIYNESLAKIQFLEQIEKLFNDNVSSSSALSELPTAYDYIRLGHPLSCLLEWTVAHLSDLKPSSVISFSSQMMPIMAILRKNSLDKKNTQIVYTGELPSFFNGEILKDVYGYTFDLVKVNKIDEVPIFDGSTVFISQENNIFDVSLPSNIDFFVNIHPQHGSVCVVSDEKNESYISEIQHVRRRESIAMTPASCHVVLSSLYEAPLSKSKESSNTKKGHVLNAIIEVTRADTNALLASSGLSVQYAILMGLIHEAQEKHSGKDIKIIVPPNCYGGTNDQARRVAASIDNVEVLDLPVDGDQDMVQSIDMVLTQVALEDAVPYIIAEIPTNPRVEVPDLTKLKDVLSKKRMTNSGDVAIDPVFILDQTFCPNVHFVGENDILSNIRTISYVSGSKFPSGGLCTAGYCVANKKAAGLLEKIEMHLKLCDNEATDLQIEVLSKQMPSMNHRISDAYKNAREFVNFIVDTLPAAKINFVSEGLANKGFTPSVFSLDLPTKGHSDNEKENYKRKLNHKLIRKMIDEIPDESKHCVSYGQLKGCYWTIPATSTQGTTKEGDKDYIVRVAISPDMNIELHKKVFLNFANEIK